jgi:surface protein A
VLIASLLASAFPAVALANSCDDYYKKMEEDMKKDGVYSDQAMKIVKDQVAAVPADQQDSFCKAAIENINNSANDNGGSDEKEEGEEAKG